MHILNPVWLSALLCVALLGAPGPARSQVEVVIGGSSVWVWPSFGANLPYPYGAYSPWGICGAGPCVEDLLLRRAIRREIQLLELRRDLELRAEGGLPGSDPGIHGIFRSPPPPTPESHLQPRYRGAGAVRPEYRDTGQPRHFRP